MLINITLRVLVLTIVATCSNKAAAQSVGSPDNSQLYDGPYIQVYPPVDLSQDQQSCSPENSSTGTCPLYIGLIQSSSGGPGGFRSIPVLPGLQLALDQINADPDLLPGYTLHYTLTDSNCERTSALDAINTQIIQLPTKIGIIGAGCSIATEPTAELSHYYNITQISCVSSSADLTDRDRFRYYFQVLAPDDGVAYGFFEIIRRFGWQRIGIIAQNERLFTATADRLVDLLSSHNISATETTFNTNEGVESLDNPFDTGFGTTIFVIQMFEGNARRVLCRAYQSNIHYPRYLFLTYGWYMPDWWVGSEEEQEELMREFEGCTVEQRERVAQYTLAVVQDEFLTDNSSVADSETNGTSYIELTERYFEASPLNLSRFEPDYSQQCYDATWLLARGLNEVMKETNRDATLGEKLADFNRGLNLLPDEEFGLQHFTYNNSGVLDIVFNGIKSLNFTGITGHFEFNKSTGVRRVASLIVYSHQMRRGFSLQRFTIGHINITGKNDLTFTLLDGLTEDSLWDFAGRPHDGQPNEEIVTVSIALTVIFALLATVGIVFAIICLVFNIIFSDRKLIRLSSPKLNLLIGTGAIVLYIDVYFFIIPTTDRTAVKVLCNITPWFTALGYSLCYGTILAKMFRVYYIFNNPTPKKKKAIQDWMLALGVLLLVVIDLIILITYTAVEGARGNLSAQRVPNRENPQDITEEARGIVTNFFIYICDSKARDITLGVLYGYKAILQVIALAFTFSIRKVKIKGLNDAKYIAAAIYVTSIVTAVIIVSIYTLKDFINAHAIVFAGGFFIGTTGILMLVFIPKMIGLYRDPKGENVFKSGQYSTSVVEQPSKEDTVAQLKAQIKQLQNGQQVKEQQDSGIAASLSQSPGVLTRVSFLESTEHEHELARKNVKC